MFSKKLLIIITVIIALCSMVNAADVVYIIKDSTSPNSVLTDTLTEMSLTYDIVEESDIPFTDFNEYRMILVGNQNLNNPRQIPYAYYPTLMINKYHYYTDSGSDSWGWSRETGLQAGNPSPRISKVQQSSEIIQIINQGLPDTFLTYNQANKNIYYLKSGKASPIVFTNFVDGHITSDAVVAVASPGTRFLNGIYSLSKSIFFGVTETQYWTPNSKRLFKNCVNYLITDYSSPQISNVQAIDITDTEATITWITDDESNSTVYYGTSPTVLNNEVSDPDLVQSHIIDLFDLSEETTYYYKVKSCNEAGYCAQSQVYNFATMELDPPVISNIELELTDTTATITWDTDEDSDSAVSYGLTPGLGLQEYDSLLTISHSIELTDLEEYTTYYYQITSCDIYDNCESTDIDAFTTEDYTAPNMPDNIGAAVDNTNGDIIITWNQPSGETPSYYNIYASTSHELASFDFNNPEDTTSDLTWTDTEAVLTSQKYYIIRSEDAAGNEESNTNTIGKYDIELQIGENLVSLPLIPFTNDINEIMNQDSSYHPVSAIKRYTASFETATFNTLTESWEGFQELEAGKAYFFLSDSQISPSFTGIVDLTQKTIPLTQGMNLIGFVILEDKQIPDIIPENDIDEVSQRNINGQYQTSTYYSAEGWYNSFNLQPGKGYWLKANKNFNLVYTP